MGKSKAQYQKEAKALGIEFTEKTTVKQLQTAIKFGAKPVSEKPAANKLSEPEQTLKDREARREADREEAALAAKNRADDQAAAAAKVRTAAQQAVDRAEGSK